MASAAGAIRRQWNGAETLSITARLIPRAVAMPIARSTAGRSPESTTWPPPLSLATSQTAPPDSCAAASATDRAASRSVPISAAMAPAPGATASCIASPRRRSSRAASATDRLPAAASAAYSPSEWPATQATSRVEVEAALGLQHAQGREARRHQGRLGVGGEGQLLRRPLEHQPRQVLAQGGIDLVEHGPGLREGLGEVLAPCRPPGCPGRER